MKVIDARAAAGRNPEHQLLAGGAERHNGLGPRPAISIGLGSGPAGWDSQHKNRQGPRKDRRGRHERSVMSDHFLASILENLRSAGSSNDEYVTSSPLHHSKARQR